MDIPKKVSNVDDLLGRLASEADYITDRSTAAAIFLSIKMQKPLLVEGPPGCGKTEIAKCLSKIFGLSLIRLQCYEGLDYGHAVYEWDYQRQLLEIRLGQQDPSVSRNELKHQIYSEEFLLERPILKAIRSKEKSVLLIDEIDRADPELEGFLFEFLSEFQISIPELGTIKAQTIPYVIITSNNSRDLSDALKRRCLYLHIDYPSQQREIEILKRKVKGLSDSLAMEVSDIARTIREDEVILRKPGTAESIDLASTAVTLGADSLSNEILSLVAGSILKDQEDLSRFLSTLKEKNAN